MGLLQDSVRGSSRKVLSWAEEAICCRGIEVKNLRGFTKFYEVLRSFTKFYEVLRSFTKFYEVLRNLTRFHFLG